MMDSGDHSVVTIIVMVIVMVVVMMMVMVMVTDPGYSTGHV